MTSKSTSSITSMSPKQQQTQFNLAEEKDDRVVASSASAVSFLSPPVTGRDKQGGIGGTKAPSLPTIPSSSTIDLHGGSGGISGSLSDLGGGGKTKGKRKRKRRRQHQHQQQQQQQQHFHSGRLHLRQLATIEDDVLKRIEKKGNGNRNGNRKTQENKNAQTLFKTSPSKPSSSSNNLPIDQYECILRRRAIRKEAKKVNENEKGSTPKKSSPKYRNRNRNGSVSSSTGTNSNSSSSSNLRAANNKGILPLEGSSEMETLEKYGITITPRVSIDEDNDNVDDKNNDDENFDRDNNNNSSYSNNQLVDEEVGDTSLGMKLTILSGKVIVQQVMPLADGRASPAQLSGKVSRGDVLLSIDGRVLVYSGLEGFKLSLLVERLKPLSTPDEDGYFARTVKVRFAVGEGLKLLEEDAIESINKKKAKKKKNSSRPSNGGKAGAVQDGAGDLFNISRYITVDHFSGTTLDQEEIPIAESSEEKESEESSDRLEDNSPNPNISTPLSPKKLRSTLPLNQAISAQIAWEHQAERIRLESGFFTLNDDLSTLLRQPADENDGEFKESGNDGNATEREVILERGKIALLNARRLYNETESGPLKNKMDPLEVVRNQCRSFSSRSRFSQRYAAQVKNQDDDSSSDESSTSSDFDSLGTNENNEEEVGDEMLLKLAVWNRTWKKRMLETLEAESVLKKDRAQEIEQKKQSSNDKKVKKKSNDIEQLQSLLFGAQVTEMMNKKKKTSALPPEEITEVLFDLASRVTATIPLNVNIIDGLEDSFDNSSHNDLFESNAFANHKADKEVTEATRFLLDDILPVWLETFKPITISQRRVLWPLVKEASDVAASDDLSMESAASGWSVGTPERRAKLAEKVAFLELDPHTRIETCNLITFYFTRKVLPSIEPPRKDQIQSSDGGRDLQHTEDSAVKFITAYGSYLNLLEGLIAASEIKSARVLQSLLHLAKYDPRFNENFKLLSHATSQIPYEQKMLPCLLIKLEKDLSQNKVEDLQTLLPLLVAAYPDIKPWQICSLLSSNTTSEEDTIASDSFAKMGRDQTNFYYEYLSMLMDSSLMARKDKTLVREWCSMSVVDIDNDDRRANFYKVASPVDPLESSIYRDLSFLIDSSVAIADDSLTVSLASEIISTSNQRTSKELLSRVVGFLRNIASKPYALNSHSSERTKERLSQGLVQQILTLFDKMSNSPHQVVRESIEMTEELLYQLNTRTNYQHGEEILVTLMTDVVSPRFVLEALSLWQPFSLRASLMFLSLRKCLMHDIESGLSDEISIALSRVREIRHRNPPSKSDHASANKHETNGNASTIWDTVLDGTATIDK